MTIHDCADADPELIEQVRLVLALHADLTAARERIAELERVCQTALDFYALPTREWVARYGAGMTTRDLGDMFRAALRTQEAEA